MNNIIDLLPKSWNDITLTMFQELKSLNKEDTNKFELVLEQLAIVIDTDTEDELFDELDIDELFKIIGKIKWLYSEPNKNFTKKIGEYEIKDLTKLTLGEFLDLEHYFGDDYIQNLHIICAILYKQYKVNEWNNIIEEPYGYDIELRSKIFNNLSINNLFGIIDYYLNYKQMIMDSYTQIFESDNWDELETEGLDDLEINELKKEIEIDKKNAKWSWPRIIYDLCNNDISKYDDITSLPLTYVLNTLTMKKALQL